MKKNRKLLLASSVALSGLLVAGVVSASVKGNIGLLGADDYSSVKSIAITFTAEDFASGVTTITKNGNPFNVVGDVSVKDGVITFAKDAGLTRTVTDGTASGIYVGASLFYEMSITGLTVDTPSQSVNHAGKTRTWYNVINDRGSGDGRGLYSSSAEADAVGYHDISHTWSNDRDDNDPSAFWIETSKPDLVATGGAFSFKTLTLKYECVRSDKTYQKIMFNNSRNEFKFVGKNGDAIAPIAAVGETLEFKLDVDPSYAKRYDIAVTYSNFRDSTTAKTTLTPNSDGVYSLVLSNSYVEGNTSDYTYLYATPTAKASTAISSAAEFAAMEEDGIYHLTADIDLGDNAPLESFSGVLDGSGHRIYSGKRRTGGPACGLFKELKGLVRNVVTDFNIDYYGYIGGGICGTLDGGIIEDVTAHTIFRWKIDGQCGGIAATATNGALIRNSTVYFLSKAMDKSVEEPIGTVVGNLGENCVVDNVKVKIPAAFDASKLEVVRSSENKGTVTNCSIVNYQEKALDDALYEGGEETTETYNGMPLRKKTFTAVNDGTEFLNSTYDLNQIKTASFFLKITELKAGGSADSLADLDSFAITGGSNYIHRSTEGREAWNYVEIRKIADNEFTVYTVMLTPNTTYFSAAEFADRTGDAGGNLLSSFTGIYSWKGVNTMTIYSTPLYVEK